MPPIPDDPHPARTAPHRHEDAASPHAHGRGGHSHGGHEHGGHGHAPKRFDAAFALGTGLNAGFVALQVAVGLAVHSVALLADAVHNTGDVLGLLLAWGASLLARRRPSARRTYGWGRGTILASLANAVVLLIGVGAIALEAIQRLGHPGAVGGRAVMAVAALGIVVNGATAMLFLRGRDGDLNIRAAFLHMAADAAVSAGVVLAALLIVLTGWTVLDPLASLAIAGVIAWSTWGLLRQSVDLALDAVPEGIVPQEVEGFLRALPGVVEVHDLHIWGLSTTRTAVTAHLVRDEAPGGGAPGGGEPSDLLAAACEGMRSRFAIGHCTFQLESREGAQDCELRPAHVV